MNRFLRVGERISLTNSDNTVDFLITELLGVGGSCIAYKVTYYENENIPHIAILKEYCPAFLEDGSFEREETSIVVPEQVKEQFIEGLDEFKRTYKAINEYLSNNISAANYHTVQMGLYEGNNTAYTLTSCDYGLSYDKIDNEDLLSICKTMLSVTKAVELYHNAGFLHLDIKPKNILVLDDVKDLIKLFDFDSLTSIEKLKSREVVGVPVPEDYYVPELVKYELRNIGIETDIFEIGAMTFLKIFGYPPKDSDMSYDKKYSFDNVEMFTGVSPQVKSETAEFLKNTVQISKRNRYKTTKEVKNKLEKIISLISDEKPYLVNLPKWQPSKYSIGRKNEIREIKKRLDSDGYVFVKGIGGIGKSEIAKIFVEQYKDEYHTIQFCKFSDSLKSVVATMPIDGIDEHDYGNVEELIKEKNKVLHLSDEKTLIVVDNFNVTYDDFLRDFLPANNKSFKVIFTTRCTMAAEYYESKTYVIPKLSIQECKTLFLSHYSKKIDDEETIEEIINFVDYNTLIIVLMAISMKKADITLEDMLLNLEEQKIDDIETKIFHEYDFTSDETDVYNKMFAHLTAIFSISGLSEIQKELLKNATLISLNGISLDDFIKYCESESINRLSVESVVSLGWINKDTNNIISMHPIISDMFSVNNELTKKDSYYKFMDCLEEFCNPDYCHFSIVLNKLACAKHLERRYKFESDAKEMVIYTKLGRMYEHIYQPSDAKKYLKMALKLAETLNPKTKITYQGKIVNLKGSYKNLYITYLYRFLGEVEQDFGIKQKAIEYYKKCINEGKKIKNRFYDIVVESMISIGECYSENNNKLEAYNSYSRALNYSKRFRCNEYVSNIADCLISICEELDWSKEVQVYKKVAEKYRDFSVKDEESPEINEFSKTIENGDFEGGLIAYEKFLAFQREKLGEDSPVYKDLKMELWVYYAINNQKEQALYLWNEALNFVAKTSGEVSIEMASQLSKAARLLIRFSDFELIEAFANRAIKICEQLGDTQAYTFVEANLSLAKSLFIQGKELEAKKYIEKIDFSAYSGNEFLEDIVESAGFILCELSEFDLVESMCLELINKENAKFIGKFQAYIILATVNEQRGVFAKAEAYAEKARECIGIIKTEHIKNEWLISYYRSMGKIYYRKGEYAKAIEELNECIKMFDKDANKTFLLYVVYLERGLYYFYSGQLKKSEEDYDVCEEILKQNNFPQTAFVVLYNNLSVNYQSVSDFKKAKEYLDKMCLINNNFREPSTYSEAIVCGNIGWVDYNLGKYSEALALHKKAILTFERLGINNTYDYYSLKNNMAIVFMSLEKAEDTYDLYNDIRNTYNPDSDRSGEIAIKSNFGIIFSLFKMNAFQEAYDFSCEELERFESWFGKTSPIRIQAILQMGGLFRENGYQDCYDFFFLADDLMEESKDYKSLNNAKLLNYIGLYFTDEKREHGIAKHYFEESKELFEELELTNDDMYPIVVENIEYVQKLIMDKLVKEMAQSILDETKEN